MAVNIGTDPLGSQFTQVLAERIKGEVDMLTHELNVTKASTVCNAAISAFAGLCGVYFAAIVHRGIACRLEDAEETILGGFRHAFTHTLAELREGENGQR